MVTPVVISPKPPVCSVTPSAAGICEGGSASFTVSASGGTQPYTTNWNGPNGRLASTSPTITINNAQTSDAGTYTATITDSSVPTQTTTCSATLMVGTVTPQSAEVCAGASATFMA